MTRIWTETAATRRRGFAARVACCAAAALILLVACGGESGGGNRIKPLKANLTFEDAVPFGEAIYFDNVAVNEDLVTVDLMLNTDFSTVVFDAISLEIQFLDPDDLTETVLKPGIVQLRFNDVGGILTPFEDVEGNALACDSSVATCVHQTTGVPTACYRTDSAACTAPPVCDTGNTVKCTSGLVGEPCTSDADCVAVPTGQTTNPLCLTDASQSLLKGIFLGGFSLNGGSGCPPRTVNGNIKLLTLGLLASATGPYDADGSAEVRVKLVSDAANRGDCEILNGNTDVGIECFDRHAIFSVTH